MAKGSRFSRSGPTLSRQFLRKQPLSRPRPGCFRDPVSIVVTTNFRWWDPALNSGPARSSVNGIKPIRTTGASGTGARIRTVHESAAARTPAVTHQAHRRERVDGFPRLVGGRDHAGRLLLFL